MSGGVRCPEVSSLKKEVSSLKKEVSEKVQRCPASGGVRSKKEVSEKSGGVRCPKKGGVRKMEVSKKEVSEKWKKGPVEAE